MLTIVLSILFLVVVIRWFWFRKPGVLEPPLYPGALPLLGHTHLFLKKENLYSLLQKMSAFCYKHDGVVTAKLGPLTAYVIGDPDDCLTVANACLRKSYVYDFFKHWTSGNLICDEVDSWKRNRKLLVPAFSYAVLKAYIGVFNSQSRKLVQNLIPLAGRGPVSIEKYILDHNMETAYRTSLQVKNENEERSQTFKQTAETLADNIVERIQKIWLHPNFLYEMTPSYRRHKKTVELNKGVARKILQQRREELTKEKKYSSDSLTDTYDKFQPLLDLMLKLSAEKDFFTEDLMVDLICSFIVGAYDTTLISLTAFLVLVGTYKGVQEKLIKELEDIFGGSSRDVENEDLPKLVYMEAVIKEAIRLYPVGPIVGRVSDKDVKLRNYTIPAGTNVGLLLYAVNRHPIWGPDADEFRPERWLEPGGVPENPNAFTGFSIGKRDCIGKRYAMMLMKITLTHLLREFRFSADETKLKFIMTLMMKPVAGHELEIERR